MRNFRLHPRPAALAASLLALSIGAGAAVAQTPAPPSYVPPAAPPYAPPGAPASMAAPPHTHVSFKERFAAANVTNDGRLTLAQAQAGLPMVARNFAAIDKDNKGYVTITDIQNYRREQRAMRREAQPPGTNG